MTVSPSQVVRGGLANGSALLEDLLFLFDTGAQLRTIPTRAANALGPDLGAPEFTLSLQGAAGMVDDIAGFTVSELCLPPAGARTLRFKNVPVFVIDVAEELDGLLGMNLINMAHSYNLYDPVDPAVPAYGTTTEGETTAETSVRFYERASANAASEGGLGPKFMGLLDMLFAEEDNWLRPLWQ